MEDRAVFFISIEFQSPGLLFPLFSFVGLPVPEPDFPAIALVLPILDYNCPASQTAPALLFRLAHRRQVRCLSWGGSGFINLQLPSLRVRQAVTPARYCCRGRDLSDPSEMVEDSILLRVLIVSIPAVYLLPVVHFPFQLGRIAHVIYWQPGR